MSNGGNNWTAINGATNGWNNNQASNYQPVTIPGTFKYLQVKVVSAPGVGKSLAFTVIQNSTASAMTCTIADTATSASDLTNVLVATAGDTFALQCVPSGAPTVSVNTATLTFHGATEGQSLLVGCAGNQNGPSVSASNYINPLGAGTWLTAKENRTGIISSSGTIKNLYLNCNVAAGTGKSYAITVYINGTASAITATLSGSNLSAVDTAHSVNVVAGDKIVLESVPTGTPTASTIQASLEFDPLINGESLLMSGRAGNPSSAVNNMESLNPVSSFVTADATVQNICPVFSAKKLFCVLTSTPGTGKSFQYALRQNGNTSVLSTTIANSATSGSDTTNVVSVLNNDLLNMIWIPTGTPTAPAPYSVGMTVFINPSSLNNIAMNGLMKDFSLGGCRG